MMKRIVRPGGNIWQSGEGGCAWLAHLHRLMRTGVGDGTECQGQRGASRGAEAQRQVGISRNTDNWDKRSECH